MLDKIISKHSTFFFLFFFSNTFLSNFKTRGGFVRKVWKAGSGYRNFLLEEEGKREKEKEEEKRKEEIEEEEGTK